MREKATRLPMDTCPAEYSVLYVGRCGSCARAMVRKKTPSEVFGLVAAWFVRAANHWQCTTCYSRDIKRYRPSVTARQRREARRRPITAEELISLRIMVGACPECGWVADENTEGHDRRGCGAFEERQRECVAS